MSGCASFHFASLFVDVDMLMRVHSSVCCADSTVVLVYHYITTHVSLSIDIHTYVYTYTRIHVVLTDF